MQNMQKRLQDGSHFTAATWRERQAGHTDPAAGSSLNQDEAGMQVGTGLAVIAIVAWSLVAA